MNWLDAVKFNENGLIPVIAQDHATGRVLMVAWQNREALTLTVTKKQAVYWSRSRKKLWHKGETSGHIQQVHSVRLDCDADVILLSVTQVGGIACHTGRESCFYQLLTDENGEFNWVATDAIIKDPQIIYGSNTQKDTAFNEEISSKEINSSENLTTNSSDILLALDAVLHNRKTADPNSSYVSSLYHKGINKILEKVGEEATEAIISAKDIDKSIITDPKTDKASQDLIYEIADVWFHTMVTLAWFDIPTVLVLNELARRFGLSGITEKAARQSKSFN